MKNSYKLTLKHIWDEAWGKNIPEIRMRQFRTRAMLKYGKLLQKTSDKKENIEKLYLNIDIEDRKLFEVKYIDSKFIPPLEKANTTFEA